MGITLHLFIHNYPIHKKTMMRRIYLIITLVLAVKLLSSFFANGQNISFSPKIKADNNTEINEIVDVWKNYIKACVIDFINPEDSTSLSFWNIEERVAGRSDLIKYSLSRGFPLYIAGDLFVYDIKYISNDFYVIKNIISHSDSLGKNIFAIFNICARKAETDFKLYNFFHLSSIKLNIYTKHNITFYYSCDFKFDESIADKAAAFYQDKLKLFDFEGKSIMYILGESVDEAKSYLGFDYSIKSTSIENAGLFIYPNIILTGEIDHYHELIHSIFIPKFPKAHSLLHEGIATYFGGSNGKSYIHHLKELSKYINSNPNIDLSQFEKLDYLRNNTTNFYYTIGAIIIDYAYSLGGKNKVISLFEHTNLYDALRIELAIEEHQINDFLRNFVIKNESTY